MSVLASVYYDPGSNSCIVCLDKYLDILHGFDCHATWPHESWMLDYAFQCCNRANSDSVLMEVCMTWANVVDVDWLQSHLSEVRVLDASWHLPAKDRDGRSEWQERCIPGAVFFDYDQVIKDQDSPLPRMLPSETLFAAEVEKLGISNDDDIVIYDTNQLFSSPRAWWMFKAMGHERVTVLNGGLQAWQDAGHDCVQGQEAKIPGNYNASKQKEYFVSSDVVLAALEQSDRCILDARSAERFAAAHMPSAANQPYTELIDNGFLKPDDQLREILGQHAQSQQSALCTCGSGVTACVIALALTQIGAQQISVYDGSWTEWGSSDEFPKVSDN